MTIIPMDPSKKLSERNLVPEDQEPPPSLPSPPASTQPLLVIATRVLWVLALLRDLQSDVVLTGDLEAPDVLEKKGTD